MIRHQPTVTRATRHPSTAKNVVREMADEMHEALVNRGMEYLTANSEIDDTDAKVVAAHRCKLRDAISSPAINKLMFEAGPRSNGTLVFELSRTKGSQFVATPTKNDFKNNPGVKDREELLRAVRLTLFLL